MPAAGPAAPAAAPADAEAQVEVCLSSQSQTFQRPNSVNVSGKAEGKDDIQSKAGIL